MRIYFCSIELSRLRNVGTCAKEGRRKRHRSMRFMTNMVMSSPLNLESVSDLIFDKLLARSSDIAARRRLSGSSPAIGSINPSEYRRRVPPGGRIPAPTWYSASLNNPIGVTGAVKPCHRQQDWPVLPKVSSQRCQIFCCVAPVQM